MLLVDILDIAMLVTELKFVHLSTRLANVDAQPNDSMTGAILFAVQTVFVERVGQLRLQECRQSLGLR